MATAPSAADLEAKAKGMKKVAVKSSTGPAKADLDAAAKIYTDNKGDLGKIASHYKVTFKPKAAFKNANDFAKQFLAGTCLAD
jgi:hypothetical protein